MRIKHPPLHVVYVGATVAVMSNQNLTSSIPVRFTDAEKAAIEAQALSEDRTVSNLVRRAVNEYLRSTPNGHPGR